MPVYLGINSGTSADALDCVAMKWHNKAWHFIRQWEYPYPQDLQRWIIDDAQNNHYSLGEYYALRRALHPWNLKAIQQAQQTLKCPITAVGVHGQTLRHCPEHGYSTQCVDSTRLAYESGVCIISDFRSSDIARNGQGAPLIPAFQAYLCQSLSIRQAMWLNLGGIANITYINEDHVRGWDVGPTNALMDCWTQKHKKRPYDNKGQWAATGKVCSKLLDIMRSDAYFLRDPPKSSHRDYFNLTWILEKIGKSNYAPEDVQATLLALNVEEIASDIEKQGCAQGLLWLFGKGYRNEYFCEKLQQRLPQLTLQSTDKLGLPPEAVESGLFAWLAYCYDKRIAIDLRQVTGARQPGVYGSKAYP